jgi:hypothetical protein
MKLLRLIFIPVAAACVAVHAIAVAAGTTAAPGTADFAAGPAPARASYVIFQLDNDLFTGSDRDYTNGARLAYLRPIPADSLNRLQGWLRDLGGTGDWEFFRGLASAIDPQAVAYDWGTGLTQLMFTPPDPELTASPPGERPYAGWLGMEFSLHAKDAKALSSVVLSIGWTGEDALAQETQEWVHRNISNSPIFQGWDSQIPGEITVNLHLDHKRRLGFLADPTADWLVQFDGYLEWGAALGNFRTDAHAGALVRAGFNLPLQYMTPRIQLGAYSHELFLAEKRGPLAGWSLYVFGGARGSAVAHDITLDGPLFRDFDTGTSSEELVGELLAGVGIRYGTFTVTFARTFRSREFDGQASSHQFGSVLASAGF